MISSGSSDRALISQRSRLLPTKNVNAGAAYFRGNFASRRGSVASFLTDEAWRLQYYLRTRRIGNAIAVDLHAKMDGGITLSEAHE